MSVVNFKTREVSGIDYDPLDDHLQILNEASRALRYLKDFEVGKTMTIETGKVNPGQVGIIISNLRIPGVTVTAYSAKLELKKTSALYTGPVWTTMQ